METIRAAVVDGPATQPVVREVQLADLGSSEVRVQVSMTGVCHTDVAWASGGVFNDYPVVLGHETAGIVDAVGKEVTRVKPGDRVALALAHNCGHCFYCESGHPMMCADRIAGASRFFDDGRPLIQGYGTGGFATATVVKDITLVKVPDDVPLEVAAIAGCAVSTGLGAVMNIAKVTPGSTVAVFGCGGIGLNVIMGSKISGAERIVAIDPSPARRDGAIKFGATDAVEPVEEILRGIAPEGFDYVFECVGRTDVMEMAIPLTRREGDVVLIGATSPESEIRIKTLELVVSQRRIHGCLTGDVRPNIDFDKYFRLYRRGLLDLDSLISGSVPLDEIQEGFRRNAAGEGIRTLVTMG